MGGVDGVGFFLFFQAEEGIRVFCLFRGLGDVYEVQVVAVVAVVAVVVVVAVAVVVAVVAVVALSLIPI